MKTTPLPEPPIDLAPWTPVQTEWASQAPGPGEPTPEPAGRGQRDVKVVVGAAIIVGGRVLACARSSPPEAAGKWEFPGGKVEPGETEVDALVRECAEELAVRIEVGARVGRNVRMSHGRAVLKVYAARLVGAAAPQPLEHAELRWLAADELETVSWLPADVPIVAALRPLLLRAAAGAERAPPVGPSGTGRAGSGRTGTTSSAGQPGPVSPSGPDGRS